MAPQPSVPPSLPPSVEEAYRRKCVQLKNRTNEVEDANDAARLRLSRIKRQVEKLRIERAFLLEQLAKRTSTNVEDSEGSPSPPPMENHVDLISGDPDAPRRKPKDKPLRTKRGHRKPSAVGGDADSKTAGSFKEPPSPTSETSQRGEEGRSKSKEKSANGVDESDSAKKPTSAFELYCVEARPALEAKNKDEELNIDEELARAWEELPKTDREEFETKFEEQVEEQVKEQEAKDAESPRKQDSVKAESEKPEARAGDDDDVEMVGYDTEDQDAAMDKDGEE